MKTIKDLEKFIKNDDVFKKLNDGEKKLVRFYNWTKNKTNQIIDTDIIVIDDIVWESEYKEFGEALKKYNVNKIIFASTWSSAINLLMYLLKIGYKVETPIIYNKEVIWDNQVEIKEGIMLKKEDE